MGDTVSDSVKGISKPRSNSGPAYNIDFQANTLRKDMYLSFLPLGLNSRVY